MAVKAGYQNVYVFRGGLPEWIKAGYPTVTVESLPKVDVPTMSSQDFKRMLDDGEDFILLDIRLNIDVEQYWIDTPLRAHVTLNELTERYTEIPAGKKLIVIDKNGKRAGLAGRYLTSKGYDDIVIVSGGMNQWIKSGLPTKMTE